MATGGTQSSMVGQAVAALPDMIANTPPPTATSPQTVENGKR